MKYNLYIFFFVVLYGCVSFEPAVLVEDKPLAHQDSATMNATYMPAFDFENGQFFNAASSVSKWQASHSNLIVGKKEGKMTINLNGVGQNWEQLSRRFRPLDFSNVAYLLLKANVDIHSKDSLKLRIDLIDEDGMMTNYYPQEQYIRAKNTAKNYKFIFAEHWEQGWPSRGKVNSKAITEIRINFNGGAENYSGKIYIEEISISDGKLKIENPNKYTLFDFSDGAAGWWKANSISMSNEDVDDRDVLKLVLDACGPAWEGIGYKFVQPIDFTKTPILRVRLKSSSAGLLRIDLNDSKDFSTNANPLLISFQATDQYVDLIYDYSDRFVQSWPINHEVDGTQIQSIKFHVNPPDNPAFTGVILIDDIVIMSKDEYEKSLN